MTIPYARQHLDDDDIRAVLDALRSDFLTQGPRIAEFEDAVAGYCGVRHAVAVSSGTAALHLACLAAGVGPGHELITSPITFVASANCALYTGGRPVFADIEPSTLTISPSGILSKLTPATKAIVPVDFGGHPADMDAIMGIARARGITVIEDAAHSIGARYKGRRVGPLADMTILSFHPVKHITTGEGGMVLTDSPELAARLALLRTHGITREPSVLTQNHGPWYYEMQALGYHYRITDIQCALGLSQLKKLDSFILRRRELAARYRGELSAMPGIIFQSEAQWAESSYHLFVIRVDEQAAGINRRELFDALRADGIGANVHYIPVHLQPYYREKFGYKEGDFPESERYYKAAITLPLFPGMTDEEAGMVIASLRRHIKPALKSSRGDQ